VAQQEQLPKIGDMVANKYRIERLLGSGGMGTVFYAQHLVTDKRVALKWLSPRPDTSADDVERFVREARAAARISHPNIVDIYDVGEHEGSLFLVMELLEGRSLGDAMRAAPLPAGPTLQSLLPAMRGLHAAHKRGFVHRDLKPDNLFLCYDDEGEPLQVKVLDFGISKVRELGTSRMASLTLSGTVMGTPHYIAPEQAEDSKSVDARADVYSMGVILYQALSGQLPYDAESLTALLLKITRGQPEPLRMLRADLPRGLPEAVMKAMAREPADRFADMGALIDALAPFAGQQALALSSLTHSGDPRPSGTTPLAAPSMLSRGPQTVRNRWMSVTVLLLVIAMAAWATMRRPTLKTASVTFDEPRRNTSFAGAIFHPKVATVTPRDHAPEPPPAPPHAPLPSIPTRADTAASRPAASVPSRAHLRRTALKRRMNAGAPQATTAEPSPSGAPVAKEPNGAPPEQAPKQGRLGIQLSGDQFGF
jgi:serine/threonine-protein kinase